MTSSSSTGPRGRTGTAHTASTRTRLGWGARVLRPGDERGSVSAEAAFVLPVLLVVLAMAIWVLACVGAQLRSTDAAAAAARLAARGQSAAQVRALAVRVAPSGAQVTVRTTGDEVEVTVRTEVRPFGPALSHLPAVPVRGRAVAAREDRTGSQP